MSERMVIDYAASEIGQHRRKTDTGRLLHCCCICGTVDVWDDGKWSTFCSAKELDDESPIPKFCSDACRARGGVKACNVTARMKEAAKEAEWRDPILVYRKATDAENYRDAVANQRTTSKLTENGRG